jgi:hypothetical protein
LPNGKGEGNGFLGQNAAPVRWFGAEPSNVWRKRHSRLLQSRSLAKIDAILPRLGVIHLRRRFGAAVAGAPPKPAETPTNHASAVRL